MDRRSSRRSTWAHTGLRLVVPVNSLGVVGAKSVARGRPKPGSGAGPSQSEEDRRRSVQSDQVFVAEAPEPRANKSMSTYLDEHVAPSEPSVCGGQASRCADRSASSLA